ncbi:hypothetical protein H310_04223 [Aphanomyces invadans]|uniref:HTH CENPB-type domain-containing protein n=1 Tax=Aphanomyces invadans TaxID=157072 RepID=A0A024UG53_9STRA|nr:hypothetical protein H310_04223 [Aphanomyces invadans]ETW05259.1 hypothetical protein H310_04223 [Aphanomyces invadans]|eukprot:XP_008866697.1 hypothetical protein H310_04223 [Aphanomyces invadans]
MRHDISARTEHFLMPRGRPVSKYGEKKPPKKFKCLYITFQKKKEVIDAIESIGMQETLNTHFTHWSRLPGRLHEGKMTLPSEVEEQLAGWVQTMRTDGVPVTPKMLQLMALE